MRIKAMAVHFLYDTAKASTRRVRRLLEGLGYEQITFSHDQRGTTFCGIRQGQVPLDGTKQEISAIWTTLGQKVEVDYFIVFSPQAEHRPEWLLMKHW